MPVNKTASKSTYRPISVRIPDARREILSVFAAADGQAEMTPVIREAIDFYIYSRLRYGRDHVRVTEEGP